MQSAQPTCGAACTSPTSVASSERTADDGPRPQPTQLRVRTQLAVTSRPPYSWCPPALAAAAASAGESGTVERHTARA